MRNMYKKIDLKKQFLVTGGAGFIGSNICIELVKKGYRVRCLDNLSTGSIDNLKEIIFLPNFEFIYGDIRNYSTCDVAMKDIDYVLHQAALGSVPRSFKNPQMYCENNVMGFLNILEAAKKNKVLRVIYASSSSVYGNSLTMPKIEGTEGMILSPYALTKKENENWATIYTKYYEVETIGLRYFNVFGRGQNPHGMYAAVIPKFIKTIQEGNRPEIYGDGMQSRDFTYINNVVSANYLACIASKEAVGKYFNIASGERIFLNSLYKIIAEFYDFREEPIYLERRTGDVRDSFADISSAKQYLGYKPEWSFTKGLEETLNWYNKNQEKERSNIS